MTQPAILHVAEYLDLDLDNERWACHDCKADLGSARDDYKRGLLVAQRDPSEIHDPIIDGEHTFSPNPEWIRVIEFYCPNCARQIETEYLPWGHPLTRDTEMDIDSLKQRLAQGEARINEEGKLEVIR